MITAIVSLLTLWAVSVSLNVDIKSNVEFHDNLTSLTKRGFHEEAPLFYIDDHHPGEFFWSEPYYPSRMFSVAACSLHVCTNKFSSKLLCYRQA